MKKYHKNIPVFFSGAKVGIFEELYFAPLELKEIIRALEIYALLNVCPIILIHIDGVEDEKKIIAVIEKIKEYNYSIGYMRKINLEIRIRRYSDLYNLYSLLNICLYCKLSLVLEDELFCCLDVSIIESLDFLRVNCYTGVKLKRLEREGSKCYKLARVFLSNYIDYNKLCKDFFEYGFNGLQIVKQHGEDVMAKVSLKQQKSIKKLQTNEKQIDVFLESDISKLNQPQFYIRENDHGICLASQLCITIKTSKIYMCPYNHEIKTIDFLPDINYLKRRPLIDSRINNCFDCGYISDNNLYREILKKMKLIKRSDKDTSKFE